MHTSGMAFEAVCVCVPEIQYAEMLNEFDKRPNRSQIAIFAKTSKIEDVSRLIRWGNEHQLCSAGTVESSSSNRYIPRGSLHVAGYSSV